jgi:hypothetical protein
MRNGWSKIHFHQRTVPHVTNKEWTSVCERNVRTVHYQQAHCPIVQHLIVQVLMDARDLFVIIKPTNKIVSQTVAGPIKYRYH